MSFRFSWLCDLLSSLENRQIAKAITASRDAYSDTQAIASWFAHYNSRLHIKATNWLAVLSCLFPERRTDRVYWLQEKLLARIIGRCLLLGSSRREGLSRWDACPGIDLGQCVEDVMRQAENYIPEGQEVTVEEIDAALNKIASNCKFSSPLVCRRHTTIDVEEILGSLYRRLSSRDAKWLTRMILKDLSSVTLPESLILRNFHFLLPHILLVQDSFDAALRMLSSGPISRFPPHPDPALASDMVTIALRHLKPITGVKIGRPEYYKARSIKHCCEVADGRQMSLERKYDGEYCQIYIDLGKRPGSLQIFSKSGKDSTSDRIRIHQTVRRCLKIDEPDCRFSRQCIVEGELLVWSDKHGRISDFHRLRKFTPRSGTLIGTENDSPPQPYEHLMIIFFDILLLDDDVCLRKTHNERRLLLKDVVHAIPGRADITEQEIFDFSRADSQVRLGKLFAKRITERWEGYVIKGCDEPYFPIFSTSKSSSRSCWIKLKKDYISGLGDTADLIIIGGRCEPRAAVGLQNIAKLRWAQFLLACLVNRDVVLQRGVKPKIRVIDTINQHSMSKQTLQVLNQFGKFSACRPDHDHGFDIEYWLTGITPPDVIFKSPFVAEIVGSGFEKPPGARHFALRFPRVIKIHWDRSFDEAVSFTELQLLAEAARAVPVEGMGEEHCQWVKRLRLTKSSSEYIVDQSRCEFSAASVSSSELLGEETDPVNHFSRHCSAVSEFRRQSWREPANQIQLQNEVTKDSSDGQPVTHLETLGGDDTAASNGNRSIR